MASNRKLSVILFCDIEGYSALMQASERKALAFLDHYKQVLEQQTQNYGGTIIKNYGDGSLCLFDSAVEAVKCAVEIQKKLKIDPKVPLRIGLHIGDIVHNADDVYGDAINIASRLEQIAVPGSVIFSRSVYNELKNQENFNTKYLGAFSFKNIQEPVQVHALNDPDIVVPKKEDFKKFKNKAFLKSTFLKISLVVILVIVATISAFTVFRSGNEYFTERGWVLLLSFENLSNDQNLDGSLDNVIATGIQQSGYINILPDSRIFDALQRMGRSKNDVLDLDMAKEVAIREGAHVIIKGDIELIGDDYLITAQIIDPETGLDLYRATVSARGTDEILLATDELVEEIRKGLGESLVSRINNHVDLPAATTPSIEALKYCAQGQNLYALGQYGEAIDMYKKALAIDSNFVWVRVAMGMYYYYLGDDPTGEIHLKNAEANLDKVTPKEKLWFTALLASSRRDLNKSIIALREYVLMYPDDGTAWYNLGNIYKGLQQDEEAINAYQESLKIYPNGTNSLINIATIYNTSNQFKLAYDYYNRAFAIMPHYKVWANLNNEYGNLLVKMDSIESAYAVYNLMLKGNDKQKADGHRSTALLNIYQGKLNNAIDNLQEAIGYRKIYNQELSELRDRMFLTTTYIMQGDMTKAQSELEEIDKISKKTYIGTTWLKYWGNLCIQTGNSAKAREINNLLKTRIYPKNQLDIANHNLLSGNIMIVEDSIEAGIELIESSLRLEQNAYTRAHLANAYYKLDPTSERAERLYKEIIDSQSIGWEAQEFYITSFLRLAEIYENRSQTKEAIAYYRKFLELWAHGDKNIELIGQVNDKIEQYTLPVL